MSQLDPHIRLNEAGPVLLIDKPVGLTSFDVIYRLRRWHGVEKAGHAGTLDPKASGLLIVCIGKATKLISNFAEMEKEYTGTLQLGIRTPSFDLETEICQRSDCSHVTREMLESVLKRFEGRQQQTPPMYSAVKYRGKPLYKYARRGTTIERQPKEIDIRELVLTRFVSPDADLRVVCSKGTYIRSLVNDIGIALGCGATLTALRRTRIGNFRVEEAVTLEALKGTRIEGEQHHGETNDYRIPA